MELGLCLDDDFYTEETKKDKQKEKPYNVKLCEREWIFNSPICSDKVEKQNITKFKADVWYRDGQYTKALKSYKFIQENPQVSSSTVVREINESVARCHIKLQQFDQAVHVIQSMLMDHGDDTSLILMLAKICASSGIVLDEIACLKRCISLHSYNHHFWYSLASAYRKAYENEEALDFTGTSQTGKSFNNKAVLANRLAEALGKSKTTNHKDSLKIFINCHHCECLREMDLFRNSSKISNQDKVKNQSEPAKKETLNGSESRNALTPAVDEVIIFMGGLSIDNENEIEARTKGDSVGHDSCMSKEDGKDFQTNDSHGFLEDSSSTTASVPGDCQDRGCCSFSVKLKSSKYSQHQTKQTHDKMALKKQLNLFAFFCLIRARFHLQRAVWTTSSFIKERLANEMAQVNERIDKYEPCKCGELKKCCLKFISQRTEANKDITSVQMDEYTT